jgi:hypothetical protein
MISSPPSHRTLDATPLVIENFGPDLQEDELCRTSVYVFASDHGNGQAFWEFRGLLRRMPGEVMSGIVGELVQRSTPNAALWGCTIAIVAGRLQATLTGAAETIDWLVTTDDAICMHGVYPL